MAQVSKKRVGAATVMAFALECTLRGAYVSEPFGDDAPYDLVIDPRTPDRELFRIQVKTASPKPDGSFYVNTHRRVLKKGEVKLVPYENGEVDFIVTKIKDSWYFIEVEDDLPAGVSINPEPKYKKQEGAKHGTNKDRWDLVKLLQADDNAA